MVSSNLSQLYPHCVLQSIAQRCHEEYHGWLVATYMEVCINGDTPNGWFTIENIYCKNGWFGRTPISGPPHIEPFLLISITYSIDTFQRFPLSISNHPLLKLIPKCMPWTIHLLIDYMSSVQDLCWLMIRWGIVLPNVLGIIYDNPMEGSL